MPSLEYRSRALNSSSVDKRGLVYGEDEVNEIFHISSMSHDGKRRSGWSGTIIGGRGKKIFVLYPKDPFEPVNRIVLQDFDSNTDMINLSHITQIQSKADLTYLTRPLTLFLPDNQKIIIASYQTIKELSNDNFIFYTPTVSSSNVSIKELCTVSALFGAMILLIVWFALFSFYHADEGKEKNRKVSVTEDVIMKEQKRESDDCVIEMLNLDEDLAEAEVNQSIDGDQVSDAVSVSSQDDSSIVEDDEENQCSLSAPTLEILLINNEDQEDYSSVNSEILREMFEFEAEHES